MTITINYDKNIQNTLDLKIHNETHTLGSVLSDKLCQDKRCTFSSYKVLHPKDDFVFVRVGCDESVSVKDCLIENLSELCGYTQDLINQIRNVE